MQKNLGAAIDLSQAWTLVYSYIQRRFFSPTPRQLIELTAPQPFMYADYYNNYLQVFIVGLCFGMLQPIILPITAFYLCIEVWFKKYLVQYVFITKTESGGRFWRLLVNRLLSAVVLANAVAALVVGAQGVGSVNSATNGNMLYAMIPLPFLLGAFKWYCKRAFDDKLSYYSTEPYSDAENNNDNNNMGAGNPPKAKRNDKVAVRFGHPALYRPLLTPMVHSKSKPLLADLYNAKRTPHRQDTDTGYSDMFFSEPNNPSEQAGQSVPVTFTTSITHCPPTASPPPETAQHHYSLANSEHHQQQQSQPLPTTIELIPESSLDFENFKKRPDFRHAFGGDGELYGRAADVLNGSRPGTPSTFTSTLGTMTPTAEDGFADTQTHVGEQRRDSVGDGISASRGRASKSDDDIKREKIAHAGMLTLRPDPDREQHWEDRRSGGGGNDDADETSYAAGYQRTPTRDRFDDEDGDHAEAGLEVGVEHLGSGELGVDEILDAGRYSRIADADDTDGDGEHKVDKGRDASAER